ncbi:MAG: hypothetical protein P8X96_14180 [Desulfobacteraceae bacterium]
MADETAMDLEAFIEGWEETDDQNKSTFLRFRSFLENQEGVALDFQPRPGVTYSLRAKHAAQKSKELFVMVDVIEDDPRWLSVCFYGEMITDPDEMGDFVPEGLLGEDAVCFDIETKEEDLIQYVEKRLDEACQSASKGA